MVAPPKERLPVDPHRHYDEENLLRLRGLQYCTQQPGTAVILPDGYWHATYQKGPWSLAIGGQGLVSDVLYDVKIENFSSPALLGLADAVVPIGLPGNRYIVPIGGLSPIEEAVEAAAASGHERMLNFLFERGAHGQNGWDGMEEQPIHLAAEEGHVALVTVLVGRGSLVNANCFPA